MSLQMGRQLTLAPALQRSLQFLQMNALEFEQELRAALADNPLLEQAEDGPSVADALGGADAADPSAALAGQIAERTASDPDHPSHDADVDGGADGASDPFAFDAADGAPDLLTNLLDPDAAFDDHARGELHDDFADGLHDGSGDGPADTAADDFALIDADPPAATAPDADAPQAGERDGDPSEERDLIADWSSPSREAGPDPVDPLDFTAQATTLRMHLWEQLRAVDAPDRIRGCCALIVDSLDDGGMLREDADELKAIAARLGVDDVTDEELDAARAIVQGFDPVGVGARDVRECLLLLLHALGAGEPGRALAIGIVRDHLKLLGDGDFRALGSALQADEAALADAMRLIRRLQARPGQAWSAERIEYAVPEILVRKVGRQWQAMLHPGASPRLRIHAGYAQAVAALPSGTESRPLQGKLQEARWLLRSIEQRASTIERTARAIVARQQRFFEFGDIGLQPMRLADIAADVGIHESTVSRVVNSKYLQSPAGLIPLKRLFTSHVETAAGQACSATAVKAMIRQLIDSENPARPLSDHRLAKMLDQRGIRIARRTVTKYRDALGIDAVEMRRHTRQTQPEIRSAA